MRYKWLLFDADNTLFDFTYSQRISLQELFQHYGYDFFEDTYAEFVKNNLEIWAAYDRNEITHEDIKYLRFSRVFDMYGISNVDIAEVNEFFIRHLIKNSKLLDGAEELLLFLHGKVKMALVTNGMKEVQRPRFEQCRLRHVFDHAFISGEIGLSKPNYDYFSYVHQATGNHDKNEYLVIGDNPVADVKGARDYGFNSCWFNIENHSVNKLNGADHVIHSLAEIYDIVKPINEK